MGYQISYRNGTVKKVPLGRRGRIRGIIAALAAAVVVGTALFPQGQSFLRDLLLPGDEAVTAKALEDLAEGLKAGEPLGETVEVFCREIIYGS